MESPVWMPTGSMFSMLQMAMAVSLRVAHHLVLDFLIALDALLHQHLVDRRELQGVFRHQPQFLLIVREAAAGAAQRERGTQHHRIADLCGDGQRPLPRVCAMSEGSTGSPEFWTQLLEQLAVLRLVDALAARAQDLARRTPPERPSWPAAWPGSGRSGRPCRAQMASGRS